MQINEPAKTDMWRGPSVSGVLVLTLTLALAAPSFIYGAPFLWYDSADFLIVGRDWIAAAQSQPWSPPSGVVGDHYRSLFEVDGDLAGMLIAARSPLYAEFFASAMDLGGEFAFVVIQCLVAAFAVAETSRLWFRGLKPAQVLAAAVLLSAFTTLPFVAGFGMPDFFGGVGILACFVLVFFWREQGLVSRAGMLLLVVYGCAVHGSNGPITLGLAALGVLALVALGSNPRGAWKPSAAIVAALVVGKLASAAAGAVVESGPSSIDVQRPPFLLARVLADGPGWEHVQEICPESGYAICAFRDRVSTNSDGILWSDDPALGIYRLSTPEMRKRLADEEIPFVLDVLKARPVEVVRAFLKNTTTQALQFSAVDEVFAFLAYAPANPDGRDTVTLAHLHRAAGCAAVEGACALDLRWLELVHYAVFGASALFIVGLGAVAAVIALRSGPAALRAEPVYRYFVMGAFVLVMLALNAAVCGGLSGPFDRYQARVAWILPLAAGLIAWSLGSEWLGARIVRELRRASRGAPAIGA